MDGKANWWKNTKDKDITNHQEITENKKTLINKFKYLINLGYFEVVIGR